MSPEVPSQQAGPPAPEPSCITKRLAAGLLPRAEELTVTLRDTLMAKDVRYATTDLITEEELMRSCRHNITRSLQSLAGVVPEDVDLVDAAQMTARRRADANFPLETLLHAYRLGTEVLWSAMLEEARNTDQTAVEDLLDSAVQVMQLMDFMSLAAADEYRVRELEAKRRDIERRQAVLDGLLEGRAADPQFAAEAMQVLELPEHARLAVVVIRHRTTTSPPPSPVDALAADGFRSEWRLRADREIGLVVLGDASLDHLLSRLRYSVDGWAGVSDATTGLSDILAEYRMADLVLASLPTDEPAVATFADRLPEVLIAANPPIAQRIREQAFSDLLALPAEKRDVLIDTLGRWFDNNRSTADTAAEMHCHRNTVVYRLNRIETMTRCRLDDARDQLLLRLALLVH